MVEKEGNGQDCGGTPWPSTCPEAVQIKGSPTIFRPPGKALADVYLLSGVKGSTQEPDGVSQRQRQIQQGHLLIPL